MLLKTHIVFNLFFFILSYNFFNLSFLGFLSFIFFILGTFIPDIDSKLSKIGKKKIFRVLQFFVKHRGFMHSLFFIIFLFFILYFLPSSLRTYFCFGAFLHLFLDSLTVNGTYPLYPLKFKIKGFIKTGKLFEKIIFISFIFLDISLFLFKLIVF
ncbi:metal-dependent hydrolase [Candidatus Woesearchaeota archaeon]|jgi:membrane-bound metal-dependent hydrolase YbcI (DUF457 family)|nr:metal-dependent hydrolase [Candidatus Woesearchaeota archaeon]